MTETYYKIAVRDAAMEETVREYDASDSVEVGEKIDALATLGELAHPNEVVVREVTSLHCEQEVLDEFAESETFEEGDIVEDKDMGRTVEVVNVTDEEASDYYIEELGTDVAAENPHYDYDDRVIEARYTHSADRKVYAFPEGRLDAKSTDI